MNKLIIIAATIALTCNGCAYVFKGERQTVSVQSVPGQADVSIGGVYYGQTPTDVLLSRNHDRNIEVSKPGYQENSVYLQHHPDAGWFFWDIGTCIFPITLCIPILVDAVSGAWMTYSEDSIAVKLAPALPPVQQVVVAPVLAPIVSPKQINVQINQQ